MKISIFPSAKAIPENKEEKKKESFNCSAPNKPVIVTINSNDELMNTLLNNAWSPSLFNGYRNNNNFISTDFMVLDIDENLTIEEASDRCINIEIDHIIMTTPSHTKTNHRFRLIIPLSQTITNKDIFDSTWLYLFSLFPEIDKACKDYARFYFGGKIDDSFYYDEGELLSPIYPKKQEKISVDSQESIDTETFNDKSILEILYSEVPGHVPESIYHFFSKAESGLSGTWNNCLNRAVFTLGLQGVNLNNILIALEKVAPYSLDKADMQTVKSSYKRSLLYREPTIKKNRHLI